jgi:hypothetical protein
MYQWALFSTRSLLLFSQRTSSAMKSCRRFRSAPWASSVGKWSGQDDGSSTSWANSTARHAASGRRAHHRCKVEGCPCRIDFSRALAALIASSGSAISISFLR